MFKVRLSCARFLCALFEGVWVAFFRSCCSITAVVVSFRGPLVSLDAKVEQQDQITWWCLPLSLYLLDILPSFIKLFQVE